MEAIRNALQKVADKLTGRRADLAKSRRRHKVWREHAERQHGKQLAAEAKAHPLRAAAFKARATRSHLKALYWKERVRRDDQAIAALEEIEDRLEAEEAAYLAAHKIRFEGPNRIRGGNAPQRARAAQTRAMLNYRNGDQPGYYSQSGASRAYTHTLFHYPPGHIWDCSTYADGLKYVTGDPSPSGPDGFRIGGYTGTELEHCTRVAEGEERCGDLVVYLRYAGDGIGHHVEAVFDPKAKQTSGHGDEAINIGANGSYDIFGDGLYVIVRPPTRHTKGSA